VDASGPSIAEFLLKRATGKVQLAFIENFATGRAGTDATAAQTRSKITPLL
jgi:hypothetical protein